MRIKSKLMLYSVLVATISVIIPSTIIGWKTFFSSKVAIEEQAKNHLISVRDIKADQIERYFLDLEKLILSFAEDHSIINATKAFTNGFNNYLSQRKEKSQLTYKKNIIQHYTTTFLDEYKRKNGGTTINVQNMVNTLDETTFALQYQYILNNPFDLKDKENFDNPHDGTSYGNTHAYYHPYIRDLKDRFNFYDIFIVDIESGDIIYSVEKELDYTTSLINGPYSKSQIGQVFQAAVASQSKNFTVLSDFSPYLPSYNQPAAFIATPIFDQTNKIGVLIFQLPIEVINNIMSNSGKWEEVGLGKTGESYLIGPDYKLRSINRFYDENPDGYLSLMKSMNIDPNIIAQMAAKDTTIGLQTVQSEGALAVMKGETGFGIYPDYRNIKVLSAYEPLKIQGLQWAILSEIDADEAFAYSNTLAKKISVNTILVICVIGLITLLISINLAKKISTPITQFSDVIRQLAKTQDLTKRIRVHSNDELKDMAEAINSLLESFQTTCRETIRSAKQMQSTAHSLKSMASKASTSEDQAQAQHIAQSGDNIEELSNKLERLSKQFKVFEQEADRISDW